MGVRGIGIDLVPISRMRQVVERWQERFVTRVFTAAEIAYCRSRKDPAPHFAARFAAKEAGLKALGTGLRRGVFWRDMGVVNLRGGKPTIALTNGALKRLEEITPKGHRAQVDLTITDDFPLAQAIVIISAVPAAVPFQGGTS